MDLPASMGYFINPIKAGMKMHFKNNLHQWNLTPAEAIIVQKELAQKVVLEAPVEPIRMVAGLDAAFSKDEETCYAAVALWDCVENKLVEQHAVSAPIPLPYIPGLLSFREGAALLKALNQLETKPDALMCDGQGIAHQRGLGVACHLGLITGLSAVGCGKTRLVGAADTPAEERGSNTSLIHQGAEVGRVVRTQTGINPVFVSPGHHMDMESSVELVLQCAVHYRITEPIRHADHLAGMCKKEGSIFFQSGSSEKP